MSWNPPPVIDEYRLIRLIGRGGMGQIHLAEDTLLERLVAVKFVAMMRPDERARQRFQLEARAIARLSHPNVVAIHRVGEFDGRPYLVTEFVRGKSLEELSKPLLWKQALRIGSSLARGLAAAHRRGVLHRDIKPANVMLTEEEQVKLLDFGLAKLLAEPAAPVGETVPSADQSVRSNLTGAGGMVGTPLYMAPETLRGAAATRSSDIYSVGAVLYELCAGMAPRQTVPPTESFEEWTELEPVPLRQVAAGVDPRFEAIIARCLLRKPEGRFASAEELCGALDAIAVERFMGDVPEGNPYRGLQAFDAKHRALFFGRDAESMEVIERLRGESLVVVAGDSGVGKSSLCRAGVLPSVSEGALEDGRTYRTISFVPGRYPIAALAAATAAALGKEEGPLTELIRDDPRGFCRELLGSMERTAGVLVFLDQAEEVFTLSAPEEVAAFSEALGWLIRTPSGIRALMTVRGDFLARFAGLPVLGEEIPRALYLLCGLDPEAARSAITEPARRKGVTFESEAIVETLVASSGTAMGGLPLLQFAMAELWEGRDRVRNQIPASALEAIGGVGGALARHADGVMASLPPAQYQSARNVLLRLVTAEGTRARRTRAELEAAEPGASPVLETLIRGRLLVAREERGETAYEVAHEALLQGWATLRDWLDADVGKRLIRERVETAASEWARLGKAAETLWSERQLAETQLLEPGDVSPLGTSFLAASRVSLRRRRYQRWALMAAAPLAGLLVLGATRLSAEWSRKRMVDQRYEMAYGEAQKGRQEKDKASLLRAEAYARFAALGEPSAEEVTLRVAKAERVWKQAVKASERADGALSQAAQILEGALTFGTGDARVQSLLGDVLLDRIDLADWFYNQDRRRELSVRLRSYDPDRIRENRLTLSPSLSITTSPAHALVELKRYDDEVEQDPDGKEADPEWDGDEKGRKKLVPAGVLGPAPIHRAELGAPGSYLIAVSAQDRVEVRYPIVLAPGESATVNLWLPPKGSIPDGFVYVPPGPFLFGSTAPDVLRRGLMRASPMHPERTDAFLIKSTEVTFAEWIRFLNSLSPEEREQHRPKWEGSPMQLELKLGKGGKWVLVLGSDKNQVFAREGEFILIPGRVRAQDWLQFPVMSVNRYDVTAYVKWLDDTGQVHGARLCKESEWERAARGADGRAYPHGDFLSPKEATIDETYQRKAFGPDEVGRHPESESPFGLLDTAGNVYEWVLSGRDENEALIRGGAWYYDAWIAFASNRTVAEPGTKDPTVGLRICANAPSPEP